MRIHELASAKIWDIVIIQRKAEIQHRLEVYGKGGQQRQVPLPNDLIVALFEYLKTRGYPNLDINDWLSSLPDDTPIIAPVRISADVIDGTFLTKRSPITTTALHYTFKSFFIAAGEALKEITKIGGTQIMKATAHWLRHTRGTHAVDFGIPLQDVMENLGHQNLQTTSLYVHAKKDRRFRLISKL